MIRLLFISLLFLSGTSKIVEKRIQITREGEQPKAAVSSDGKLAIVYGTKKNIFSIYSPYNTLGDSKPTLVGELDGLMLGMGRGPQITTSQDNIIISAVNKEGNVYSWTKSKFNGKWSQKVKVNDKENSAKEGFTAVCSGNQNEVYVIWTDTRDGKANIYGAYSINGGKTWSKNLPIYKSSNGICPCCKLNIVYNKIKNKVYVMWRNELKGERNLYVKEFSAPSGTAIRFGTGTWKLNGCPMDGGDISCNDNGEIFTTWRRKDSIFVSEIGKKEVFISTGRNPSIVSTSGSPYIGFQRGDSLFIKKPGSNTSEYLTQGAYPELVKIDQKVLYLMEAEEGGIKLVEVEK